MSWHCLICGNQNNKSSEGVTGLMYLYDIRGGIPLKYCIHLDCLVEAIDKGTEDYTEFTEEVMRLHKQN